jgi:hypothetical protein
MKVFPAIGKSRREERRGRLGSGGLVNELDDRHEFLRRNRLDLIDCEEQETPVLRGRVVQLVDRIDQKLRRLGDIASFKGDDAHVVRQFETRFRQTPESAVERGAQTIRNAGE